MKADPTAPAEPTFGSSLRWSYTMEGARQVSSIATMFVLARILGPEAFGIVALASVYVFFVRMVLNQGLSAAIIQRRDLDPRHLDAAFWLLLVASLVLTALSIALAGWWAAVNRTPALEGVIIALSVLIPVQALALVQEATIRRAMAFRGLAVRSAVSTVLGGLAGIGSALAGAGLWALVVQLVVTEVLGAALLWRIGTWRPGWRWSPRHARDLMGFSSGSFLATVGVFANNRIDTVLIGLFFGPVVVGVYRLAARLVDATVEITVRGLSAVAFPALSKLQDHPGEFSERTLTIVRLSALAALPPLALLAVSSAPVTALLGPQWAEASVPLVVLCGAGILRSLNLLMGPVLTAAGRPHFFAGFSWLTALVSALGLCVAGVLTVGSTTEWQLLGMSVSRVLVQLGVMVASIAILDRSLGLRAIHLARAVVPAVVATAALTAAALTAGWATGGWAPVGRLAVAGSVGTTVLAVAVVTLEPRARSMVRRLLNGAKEAVATSPG